MSNVSQQPFPRLGTAFVDEQRMLAKPWYRLLITLWQRTGANLPIGGTVILNNTPGGIQALDAGTGALLGYVPLTAAVGGPPVVLAPAVSPFGYQATAPGTLVVTGAQVELRRGAIYYIVSPAGGAIPMLINDIVRLTWYNPAQLPTATFFPSTV